MEEKKLLINKPMPKEIEEKVNLLFKDEKPCIAVISDINKESKYDVSALIVSFNKLIVFDNGNENGYEVYPFENIEEVKVKRLYGNAVFYVLTKDGKLHTALRSTYVSADIIDIVADFINNINEGQDKDEQYEIVRSVYDKIRSFCPKCGRKLPRPNAECINCAGKNKILSKLMKYLLPEKSKLITSVFFQLS